MPITIVLMLILLNIFSIHFMGNLEDKNRKVILITEYGEIEILLYEKTPLHSDNFITSLSLDSFEFKVSTISWLDSEDIMNIMKRWFLRNLLGFIDTFFEYF